MRVGFNIKRAIPIMLLLFVGVANAQQQSDYTTRINDWHKERIKSLVSENGWVNIAGLFWLEEGIQQFGADSKNKFVFPANSIARVAGTFIRKGNTVYLEPAANVTFTINGVTLDSKKPIFTDTSKSVWISHKNLRFTVIKRGDKLGIRLRDLASPKLASFKEVDRFAVDSNWKVQASIDKNSLATTIPILNVLGQTTETPYGGKVVFFKNNQRYTLDAIDEGNDILVVFGDRTSGNTTYHGGRFISIPKKDLSGFFELDFNKAYNPPCVFTPYATCPLPPPQNILPFAVTAGEKKYGEH